MKRYILFLLLPLLWSCSDAIMNEEDSASDKLVEVSFDLGGAYDIDFETITRASIETGDLVGIQVYECTSTNAYTYAYGLFDGKPNTTLLLKAGKTYKYECLVVKDGVQRIRYSKGYAAPFSDTYLYPTIGTTFSYSNNGMGRMFWNEYQRTEDRNSKTRPGDIVAYGAIIDNYHPMENGVVKFNLKCNKAPQVRLNFTSDVPDGKVTGTMKYFGANTQTWNLSQSNEVSFQRDIAPWAQIFDGTWWGGIEQLEFKMTWERGPEANSFITTHKNVTLTKTIDIDNDKNYIVNLHFRGQSDSDPEIWVDVDVDPDHDGDLNEEDDSNE